MEINFGRTVPYSLGLEEELQILDGESLELVSRIDEILSSLEDEQAGEHVKPELLQSVVEISTSIAGSVAEAVEHLASLRARLREVAAETGSLIAAAGTHPFSRYREQDVTERERYAEFMERMRWLGERQVIFGFHVHVGVDTPDKAIACANALRTHLPELLALAVNSPFWQGRETGLDSTRVKIFDGLLRSGLPPAFASFEEFELLVERGVRTNAFPDYTHIWWDVRPHPKLGTIETRICDAQTRLAAAGSLAALIQCLVATLGAEFEAGGPLPIQPVTLIEENKWRAARDGLRADLIDLEHDTERPAAEAVRALVERCRPASLELGCAAELHAVEELIAHGTGADDQRRFRDETGDLRGVARRLAEETVRDLSRRR